LLDKEPTSKLCDELGLQPTVFYRWQKEFFENGAAACSQSRMKRITSGQFVRNPVCHFFEARWSNATGTSTIGSMYGLSLVQ
jgi:hypothetical protein